MGLIDWLSFTVHGDAVTSPLDWAQTLRVCLGIPDLEAGPQERGIVGFTHSAPLVIPRSGDAVTVGKIGWGGESQRGRVYLSLGSSICARVAEWATFTSVLDLLAARITRVDLAHDDLHGTRSVDDAVTMYNQGLFKSGGRNPSCSFQGDWMQVSGDGRTFYVGKRGNGKLLRVYEKGKQLGDQSSAWVHWEAEIHNRDRIIPFDVLTSPDKYLAGCFPALSFVSQSPAQIPTQRKVLEASLEHMINCLSKSYGKTINAMIAQGYDPDDIVARTVRAGVPNRLKRPLAGLPSDAKLYEAGDGEP